MSFPFTSASALHKAYIERNRICRIVSVRVLHQSGLPMTLLCSTLYLFPFSLVQIREYA